MTCPRCHSALLPDKHPTGIAWRCHGCGGQSLNFSQFRRVIPDDHANGIWEIAMLNPQAPSIRSLCPECQRDMAAVIIPFKEREVELDVCRGCQRVWLDRQERIAGHLREHSERGPQPEVRPISIDAKVRMVRHMTNRAYSRFNGRMSQLLLSILIFTFLFALTLCIRRR